MEKEKKMYALIAEQEQSGETVKAFAQKHGISYPTWYKWRKKYRRVRSGLRCFTVFSQLAKNTILILKSA
jgi:transposase-like protein